MTTGIGSVLWRLAPMIYGPTILYAVGLGTILPVLPVLATDLGADVALAALVTAGLVVGQLIGNLPAGWAVSRIGEKWSMAIAAVFAAGGVVALLLAPSLAVLAAAVFVVGISSAVFGLSRHSFMTTRVPLAFRARALSVLGGTFRLGMFVGPFIAAALLALTSDQDSTLWFFGACLTAAFVLVVVGVDPERVVPLAGTSAAAPLADAAIAAGADTGEAVTGPVPLPARAGVLRTMWRHRGVLLRLGLAASTLSAVRSARQLVLPLWGVSIGLDASTIAIVVGISGAVDFALFYTSGQIMDRFGRLWAALPAMVLMGAGFLALSFTHDVAQPEMWFAALGVVLGVGNGLSSGILLTLGADVAPAGDPAPFLGSWRTLTDAGGAAAPLIVSGVTGLLSLPIAVAIVGLIGLSGAAGFARWVPRYAPRPTR